MRIMKVAAVILAAGKGTRMNQGSASPIPKVMFKMADKPIIGYSVQNIKNAGISNIVLVVGYKKELVKDYLKGDVSYAVQEEQLGTAHAVKQAKEILAGKSDAVLVYYGDMPLLKPETIKNLCSEFERQNATIALLSVNLENPEHLAFGRIIRGEDGEVIKNVEQKDCSPEELKVKECNIGFYVFDAEWLWGNIGQIENNNAQEEYYLTDLIGMAKGQGKKIIAMPVLDESEALGINTLEQLKEAEAILEMRDEK